MMFLDFCNGYFWHITHGSSVPGTHIRRWLRRLLAAQKLKRAPVSNASRSPQFPTFFSRFFIRSRRVRCRRRYSGSAQKRAQFAEKMRRFCWVRRWT